jgi:hypothetical protein
MSCDFSWFYQDTVRIFYALDPITIKRLIVHIRRLYPWIIALLNFSYFDESSLYFQFYKHVIYIILLKFNEASRWLSNIAVQVVFEELISFHFKKKTVFSDADDAQTSTLFYQLICWKHSMKYDNFAFLMLINDIINTCKHKQLEYFRDFRNTDA